MKNMQYVPIKEKSPTLVVDNPLSICVLALLALMGEQARRERQNRAAQQQNLPVIVF